MQTIRNCGGKGSPAKLFLNHNFYLRCPRATFLENYDARFLVSIYFDCKGMNMYPHPGGPLEQTGFTIELFNFLDGIVAESRDKNEKAQESKAKSSTPKKR